MESKAHVQHAKPPELENETRFAVVMYGGISLAIYIHGVTQELYSLVRATARREDGEYLLAPKDLHGAEFIYRALGETLKTRFVVDILSGTSAGGINAVYLAKALVYNQSINKLKELWINEGDINLLVNDGESLQGLSGLKLQFPPSSLLNNQRMYYKLLDAFKKMETSSTSNSEKVSPYVQELDLSVTASDIRGLVLPLNEVENAKVKEARFKTVFQFHYSTKRAAGDSDNLLPQEPSSEQGDTLDEVCSNQFTKEYDPFLAFAARCTSSIPPAFEPMQLADIEPILKTATFKDDYRYDPMAWKDLYKDYFEVGDDFTVRSFGDGGYLDNKPFSYATETLRRRRADFPVNRKLVYIEPSPEHPEDQPLPSQRPDVVENAFAALIGLPRQEPIREDLKVIDERNKIIERINSLISELKKSDIKRGRDLQIKELRDKKLKNWQLSSTWAEKYVDQVVSWYGPSYVAYHHIRIDSVLSELSITWSRAMGWGENSQQEKDLHKILHEWRNKKYSAEAKGGLPSENDILYRLDIPWRLRRLQFIQDLIDLLLDQRKSAREQVGRMLINAGQEKLPELEEYRSTLLMLKKEFSDVAIYLRACGRDVRARNQTYLLGENQHKDSTPSTYYTEKFGKKYVRQLSEFKEYLETQHQEFPSPVTNLSALAESIWKDNPADGSISKKIIDAIEMVESLSTLLASRSRKKGEEGFVRRALTYASIRSRLLLGQKIDVNRMSADEKKLLKFDVKDIDRQVLKPIQDFLYYFFERYDYYDMLIFPIQYGTDVGETAIVDIVRVSPEEATMIVDERSSGRQKLAGTKLASFGAFFAKEWRQNDMLWGRLDGAEILIRQLLYEDSQDQQSRDNKLVELCKSYTSLLSRMEADARLDLENADDATKIIAEKQYEHIQVLAKESEKLVPVANYPGNPSSDYSTPFDLAFQAILDEDLKPRDVSLLYEFLDGNLSTRTQPQITEKAVEEPEPLRSLLAQEEGLSRLELDIQRVLRKDLGSGWNPFRQRISTPIELEREQLKKIIQEERKKLAKKIDETKTEMARQTQQAQNVLANLDKASRLTDAAPKSLAKRLSKQMQSLWKNDKARYRDLMRAITKQDDQLLAYFKYGYHVNTDFEPEPTIKIADRMARVFGQMMQGLSDKYPIKKPAGLFAFLAQIFSAIVQFALPKTLFSFLFSKYWVGLLYLSEIGIWFIGGFFMKSKDVAQAGFTLIVVTAFVHLSIAMVNVWLRKLVGWKNWLLRGILAVALLTIIFLIGAIFYFGLASLNYAPQPPQFLRDFFTLLTKIIQNNFG